MRHRPDSPAGRGVAPVPVERVRGEHPDDPTWRADALAGSRHSRLADQLLAPARDLDPERAAAICAEVARHALRDFAPALMLLPPPERRRVQALTAFALTLFDFARQSGLDGERLAQLNRWDFDLEAALDGNPPAQPVFLVMAAEERRAPWNRDGLDDLLRAARHRATVRRPATAAAAAGEAEALGGALLRALLPPAEPQREGASDESASAPASQRLPVALPTRVAAEPGDPAPVSAEPALPSESLLRLAVAAGAVIRVRSLQDLGDDLRRHRAQLGADELPESWSKPSPSAEDPAVVGVAGKSAPALRSGAALEELGRASESEAQSLDRAVRRECRRLRPLLADAADSLTQLPATYRAAAEFHRRAALRLLARAEKLGARLIGVPPRLGIWGRLVLLFLARRAR